MPSPKNAVVLLTGGSRGIGPVIAEALASRGAHLALVARSAAGLWDVAARLSHFGTQVVAFPADVAEELERERLVKNVVREFGRIDVLINNAGIETEGAFAELPWEALRENIEVNLAAPVALTHMFLPYMLASHSGHIVNIASIAAKSGAPYAAIYSGTKAGLAEWSRALRLELEETGVQVSTVFPGYIRELGMFARFGVQAPWIVGSCSPEQVAQAVVACIERDKREMIVNSRPLRYSFLINELSPTFGDWLIRFAGIVAFQRRKVKSSASRAEVAAGQRH